MQKDVKKQIRKGTYACINSNNTPGYLFPLKKFY